MPADPRLWTLTPDDIARGYVSAGCPCGDCVWVFSLNVRYDGDARPCPDLPGSLYVARSAILRERDDRDTFIQLAAAGGER